MPGAEKYATKAIERASQRGFFVACEMSLHEDYLDDLRENVNHLAQIGCQDIKKDLSCCVFYKHGWSQKVRQAARQAIWESDFGEKCRNIENIAKKLFE